MFLMFNVLLFLFLRTHHIPYISISVERYKIVSAKQLEKGKLAAEASEKFRFRHQN